MFRKLARFYRENISKFNQNHSPFVKVFRKTFIIGKVLFYKDTDKPFEKRIIITDLKTYLNMLKEHIDSNCFIVKNIMVAPNEIFSFVFFSPLINYPGSTTLVFYIRLTRSPCTHQKSFFIIFHDFFSTTFFFFRLHQHLHSLLMSVHHTSAIILFRLVHY